MTQGEPDKEGSLRTGEKIVKISSRSKPLSRSGRDNIKFRVVGDRSHGWAEAAVSWGGTVEVITHKAQDNHRIRSSFNLPRSIPVSKAQLPPFADSNWNGVLLATIQDDGDAEDVRALFEAWQPLIVIIALPSNLSRKKRSIYSSFKNGSLNRIGYQRKDVKVRHEDVGGVTESAWHFVHFNRIKNGPPQGAIMMAPQFSCLLQTALDDTQGAIRGK